VALVIVLLGKSRLAQEAEGAGGRLNKKTTRKTWRAAAGRLFYFCALANVGFWHKADLPNSLLNVCFWG
jgi:hypothetical protein